MDPDELVALAAQVLAPTYRPPPIVFTGGEGCWLHASSGERYLDLTSGIAVTSLGHASPVVRGALARAATGLIHTSNLFYTEPAILLARDLVAVSFAARVFFCNSGAEAVEGALKFARLAAGERRTIVYFEGSFHGRTMGALAATDKQPLRAPFEPLAGGFRRLPFDDERALAGIDTDTAAVIVEPVQGEGGVRTPSTAWLQALRARCTEVGALLIADEIQCGLGRTGTLWAYEGVGIEPDILTVAKPLAGGLPMGAILLGARAAAAVTPRSHGSTFGGGPVVASVARAVLAEIAQPAFLAGVRQRAEALRGWLTASSTITGAVEAIRGRGLLMGLLLREPLASADVVEAARDQRLLVVGAGPRVVRLLPPLNAPLDDLQEGVDRLSAAFAQLRREPRSSSART